MPFKASFNGASESFGVLSVYAPSPLRIENVQHDAVLQVGLEGKNNVIILVPLVASSLAAPSVEFMGKVGSSIQSLAGPGGMVDAPGGTTDNVKKIYSTLPVPTGSKWKLTDMIGPTDPYFTWVNAEYDSYVRMENPSFKVMGWKPRSGTRYIVMQNAVPVSENDLASIRMLPITDPLLVIPSLAKVFYKAGTPKDCKTCVPNIPRIPAFQDIGTSTLAPPSGTGGSGSTGFSTETILTILGYVTGGLALAVAVYFGVKYAMDNKWASVLPKIGETLQRKMAEAYAKSKRAMPTGAPGPSMNPGPPGANKTRTGLYPIGRTPRTRRVLPGPIEEIAAREPEVLPEPVGEVVGPRRTPSRRTPTPDEERAAAGVGPLRSLDEVESRIQRGDRVEATRRRRNAALRDEMMPIGDIASRPATFADHIQNLQPKALPPLANLDEANSLSDHAQRKIERVKRKAEHVQRKVERAQRRAQRNLP
jgi:hypothetical protein